MAFQIAVGMVFRGYCNGAFGRDAYGDKRVEAFGVDWIVVRDDDGDGVSFANFKNQAELLESAEKWIAENGRGWGAGHGV